MQEFHGNEGLITHTSLNNDQRGNPQAYLPQGTIISNRSGAGEMDTMGSFDANDRTMGVPSSHASQSIGRDMIEQ